MTHRWPSRRRARVPSPLQLLKKPIIKMTHQLRVRDTLRARYAGQEVTSWCNRPLPSSKNPHFQNEARYTTFLVKMSFICMTMKNDFHIKG